MREFALEALGGEERRVRKELFVDGSLTFLFVLGKHIKVRGCTIYYIQLPNTTNNGFASEGFTICTHTYMSATQHYCCIYWLHIVVPLQLFLRYEGKGIDFFAKTKQTF